MLVNITRNWWAVGLRGLLAILFGIGAFAWPGITLEVLVLLFGFYSIADGVFGFVAAGSLVHSDQRGWLIFEALISIITGIVALVWPAITALALLILLASYAIVTGVLEIVAALRPSGNRLVTNRVPLGLSGILSIVFGILLLIWPASGLLSLVWLIGFYALLFGLMLIGMAYQLYKVHRSESHHNRSSLAA